MHIICLTPVEKGVYNDHKADHITTPPDGWAYIPDDFPLPSTFPRLGRLEAQEMTYTKTVEVRKEVVKTDEIELVDPEGNPYTVKEEHIVMEPVTEQQEYTMMTVVSMTEGTLPEPEQEEAEPTTDDVLNALLGVNE